MRAVVSRGFALTDSVARTTASVRRACNNSVAIVSVGRGESVMCMTSGGGDRRNLCNQVKGCCHVVELEMRLQMQHAVEHAGAPGHFAHADLGSTQRKTRLDVGRGFVIAETVPRQPFCEQLLKRM